MDIHWQIPFASLRTSIIYTVNVYDAEYSGSPVTLTGAAQPFTTDEDGDDDPFAPVLTQSGNLNIIDTGYATDGQTVFDWKSFIPDVAHNRPVTLTHVVNGTTAVDWQGFIQAQDYSGTLYGDPQERKFPVCCPISVLNSVQPSTTDMQRRNFAYLLDQAISSIETLTDNIISFDTIIIQGNADAQQWLHKQFEWMNFMDEGEEDADIAPHYNMYEMLEDSCKFWGWTCRSQGRTLYLTCYDDMTEPKFVSMTRQQLQTMASGTVAGTNDIDFVSTTLSGDIFASTDNDDFKRRGPGKASVKGDCNQQDTIFQFAPPSVRKQMDSSDYIWVAGEEAGTGYYTTTPIHSFDSLLMAGSATTYGGFVRRQIYSEPTSDKPTLEDMFIVTEGYEYAQSPVISIQTKRAMYYNGGTIKIKADVYDGAVKWKDDDDNDWVNLRIGIGMTHTTAKWYYIQDANPAPFFFNIVHGWQSSPFDLIAPIGSTGVDKVGSYSDNWLGYTVLTFDGIPCDDNSLYGYIFIDIIGLTHNVYENAPHFEIGNLEIEFSRDEIFIPSSSEQTRPRFKNDEDRVSSREYTANNNNGTGENWDADCIFASDNNMDYGYGLLINPDGTFMDKARYGHDITDPDIHNKVEHPEQHLANRVAAYWMKSRRQVTTELRTDAIPAITPQHRITLDGTIFNPTAISHDWRDDITILTLLESEEEQ